MAVIMGRETSKYHLFNFNICSQHIVLGISITLPNRVSVSFWELPSHLSSSGSMPIASMIASMGTSCHSSTSSFSSRFRATACNSAHHQAISRILGLNCARDVPV